MENLCGRGVLTANAESTTICGMKKNGKNTPRPDATGSAQPKAPPADAREGRAEHFVPLQEAMEQEQPLQELEERAAPRKEQGRREPEDRAERIRRLKEQVQNGSYQPDFAKVARVILYDDTDSFLGP